MLAVKTMTQPATVTEVKVTNAPVLLNPPRSRICHFSGVPFSVFLLTPPEIQIDAKQRSFAKPMINYRSRLLTAAGCLGTATCVADIIVSINFVTSKHRRGDNKLKSIVETRAYAWKCRIYGNLVFKFAEFP